MAVAMFAMASRNVMAMCFLFMLQIWLELLENRDVAKEVLLGLADLLSPDLMGLRNFSFKLNNLV